MALPELTRESIRTFAIQEAHARARHRFAVGETAIEPLEMAARFAQAFDASKAIDEVLKLEPDAALTVIAICARFFQPGGERPNRSAYAEEAERLTQEAIHLRGSAESFEDEDVPELVELLRRRALLKDMQAEAQGELAAIATDDPWWRRTGSGQSKEPDTLLLLDLAFYMPEISPRWPLIAALHNDFAPGFPTLLPEQARQRVRPHR